MPRRPGPVYVTAATLLTVFIAAEATARLVGPRLPQQAGRWPHPTIARKHEQMRSLARDHARFDVVFVGSSMVVNGIDPVLFTRRSGRHSYNAAFPAASGRSTAAWTTDIVMPLLRPKVVVVGITSRDLNDNGKIQRERYRELVESPGYKQMTSGLDDRLEGILERYSHFLRYRREFRRPTRLVRHISGGKRGERAPISRLGKRIGKRWNAHYRAREKWKAGMRSNALRRFAAGGTELRGLERLSRRLAEEGVRMVVVSMPVTHDYIEAHPAADDMAEYRRTIERFAARHDISFIDAERALPGTDGFGDPIHLDGQGREVFTRALAERWGELVAAEETTLELEPGPALSQLSAAHVPTRAGAPQQWAPGAGR